MKRRIFLAFALLLVSVLESSADNLVARFDLQVHRFVADPARHRIYASLMADDAVAVIDSQTRLFTQTIPVGLAPAGMALSPDGLSLYVALSGTTRVGVIDLTTLATLQPLTVAIRPWQVAAGLGNRLYLTPLEDVDGLIQVDATTGGTQATLDPAPGRQGLLQISSDFTTLYFGDARVAPSTLKRYDVSTATPALLETSDPSTTGNGGVDLKLSHDGTLLAYPNVDGNNADPASPLTDLIDSMNFSMRLGSLPIGAQPSFLTFSPDDGVVYEHRAGAQQVSLFDAATAEQFSALPLLNDTLSDLITDESGRYLFVASEDFLDIYDLLADVTATFYGTTGELTSFQVPILFQPTTIDVTGLPAGLTFDDATKVISGIPIEDGTFEVVVTAGDATRAVTATLTLVIYPDERAQNISTRANVGVGYHVLIAGFIVSGADVQDIVMRGIAPSLGSGGESIPGLLDNPTLTLYNFLGEQIGSNDDWQSDRRADALISSGLAPTNPLEPALYRSLAPGYYTVQIRGVSETMGVALAEVYNLGGGESRLANLSTRGGVGSGDDVMIGGLIISGTDPAKMVIRGIGPSIFEFMLNDPLGDPQLDLYDAEGSKIASNDNWKDTQEAEIMAAGLAPRDERESAISISLAPGAYTAILSGVGGTVGVGLVEAYNLP